NTAGTAAPRPGLAHPPRRPRPHAAAARPARRTATGTPDRSVAHAHRAARSGARASGGPAIGLDAATLAHPVPAGVRSAPETSQRYRAIRTRPEFADQRPTYGPRQHRRTRRAYRSGPPDPRLARVHGS